MLITGIKLTWTWISHDNSVQYNFLWVFIKSFRSLDIGTDAEKVDVFILKADH